MDCWVKKAAPLHQIQPPWLLLEMLECKTINYSYNVCWSRQILEIKKKGAGMDDVCVCVWADLIAVPHLLINFLA